MTVLVTGGAGYIGSHMVWQLLDSGEDVVVLDRLSTGFDWAVPMEAKLYVGDIGNADLVAKIIAKHKIKSIIHFAALTVVPDSFADPISYYENNTAKAMSLIGAAVRGGVENFIFSSTAAVYGTTGTEPVDENHSTLPVSPYGMSKLMTERVLADACLASGMKYTILRYFNVAGADPKGRTGQSTPAATHLIKAACEAATGKRAALSVFGTDYPSRDGTCERDFIHVSDLTDLHYRALCRLRAGHQSLLANAGYGTAYSVKNVIQSVERVTGKRLPAVYENRRGGDVMTVIADNARARQEFEWQPKYADLDVIIASSLAWEQALAKRNTTPSILPEDYDMWDMSKVQNVKVA
ncbi:MAG: UDP-glucose 4-epimerase GalE [Notoacmeibacter sp.]